MDKIKFQELKKGDYIYYIEQNNSKPVVCKEKIMEVDSYNDVNNNTILCFKTKSFNHKGNNTKEKYSFGIMVAEKCSTPTHIVNVYNGSKNYYYNRCGHFIFGTSEDIVKEMFNKYMDFKIRKLQDIIDGYNNKKFNMV